MPPTDRQTKSKVIGRSISRIGSRFSTIQLVIFAFIFSAIGGYTLISTFASTDNLAISGSCSYGSTGGFMVTGQPYSNFYYSFFSGPSYYSGDPVVSGGQDLLGNTGASGSVIFSLPYSSTGYNDGYGINDGTNTPIGGTIVSVPACSAAATYNITASCSIGSTGGFTITSSQPYATFYYSIFSGPSYYSGDPVVSAGQNIPDNTGPYGSVTIPEPYNTNGYNDGYGIDDANDQQIPGTTRSLGPCSPPTSTLSINSGRSGCNADGSVSFTINSTQPNTPFYYSFYDGNPYENGDQLASAGAGLVGNTGASSSITYTLPANTLGYNDGDGIYTAAGAPAPGTTVAYGPCSTGQGGGTLSVNGVLSVNQRLTSTSGAYYVIMQTDGNLVLYTSAGKALWNSGTSGSGSNNRLVMQNDGNLVLYTAAPANTALWQTHTSGSGSNNRLVMQNDGNLVLYTAAPANTVLWQSGTVAPTSTLSINSGRSGCNADGSVSFTINSTQPNTPFYYSFYDGNPYENGDQLASAGAGLVGNTGASSSITYTLPANTLGYNDGDGIYTAAGAPAPGTTVAYGPCSTGQGGANGILGVNETLSAGSQLYSTSGNVFLAMQTDGNLVLYNAANDSVLWQTHTSGSGSNNRLVMQNDGNLVMYTPAPANVVKWQSDTSGSGTDNHLSVQNDGNLVIYTSTLAVVWQSGSSLVKPTPTPAPTPKPTPTPTLSPGVTPTPITHTPPPTLAPPSGGGSWNCPAKTIARGGALANSQLIAQIAGSNAQTQEVICAGFSQIGVPYRWGWATPGVGFDCSGLVMYMLSAAGIRVPHYTVSQLDGSTPVSLANIRPGDIVFYNTTSGFAQHEAMYVGNNTVIQALETGTNVGLYPFSRGSIAGIGNYSPVGN